MALEPGTNLHNRYRIRHSLGRGGMGAVYLAEDLNLAGRLVAVKENLNQDDGAQRQFRREAVLLAHLRHPNLPQVIDFFQGQDGRQYLVMEYVPGENLQEALRKHGPLSNDEAVACIDQIMQAVAYMHNQRDPETGRRRAIIHRDIKPANIKRTPDGRYVLVDFGIAKQFSATQAGTALSARALTPGYAPPEQYGGGTDERSDVYALGATLYALLSGKTPPSSIELASGGATLPSLRTANNKITTEVAKAVDHAMRLNTGDRYASVDEMYTAITGHPLPTTPITTAPPPRRRAGRSGGVAAWVLAAFGLLSAVALWWVLANSNTMQESATASPVALISSTDGPEKSASSTAPGQASTTPVPVATSASDSAAGTSGGAGVTSTAPSSNSEVLAGETSMPAPQNTPTVESTATLVPTPMPTITESIPASVESEPTTAPQPTVTNAPTATRTPIPTSTPLSTSTPVATATRKATAAATPGATRSAQATSRTDTTGGPISARILEPVDNYASDTSTTFRWVADAPLAPGQEFEVIFWRAAGGTQAQGRGILRSATASQVTQPIQTLAPDAYRWALILVQSEPSYVRLRTLAGPFNFTVPGEWNPQIKRPTEPPPTPER